ncbi:MAG TPA: DUF2783 domain-containing protein [Woeseiaceae bacterium]|nr:DUF2783 domain-containing protein [Woeseiaceae bacterium]
MSERNNRLSFEHLEEVYEWLAAAIDAAGPEKEALFLAKLCLTLAHEIGDLTVVERAVEAARADLNR